MMLFNINFQYESFQRKRIYSELSFISLLFVVVVFCSNLYGIDMNNLSLPEQSAGNGHVSISGMYLPWKCHDCTCN